jgi:hypothetical protein
MSEMAPVDAGFDLSIRGFGQASGGARARRGNNRQGFVEQSSDEDYVDDDGEDYDSDGDLDSGDSDYTWSVMTFLRIVITLKIDAGA